MSCCGNNANGCCKTNAASSSSSTAVSLPKKGNGSAKTQAVWSLEQPSAQTRQQQLAGILSDEQPLGSKCGVHERGTCCKDLKDDDERHLISPEIVRDV
jgi:hypothetical protein